MKLIHRLPNVDGLHPRPLDVVRSRTRLGKEVGIIEYVDRLGEDVPEFLSAAELAEVLDCEAAWLGRQLSELHCRSTRDRVTSETGQVRQVRGYLTSDLLAAADRYRSDGSTGEEL